MKRPRVLQTLDANCDVPAMGIRTGDVLFVRDDFTTVLARKFVTDYRALTRLIAQGQLTLDDDEDDLGAQRPNEAPGNPAAPPPAGWNASDAVQQALAQAASGADVPQEPEAEDLLRRDGQRRRIAGSRGEEAWPSLRYCSWRDRVLSRTPRPCRVCGAGFVYRFVYKTPSRSRCPACVAAKKQRCAGCGLVFTAATIQIRRCRDCFGHGHGPRQASEAGE